MKKPDINQLSQFIPLWTIGLAALMMISLVFTGVLSIILLGHYFFGPVGAFGAFIFQVFTLYAWTHRDG